MAKFETLKDNFNDNSIDLGTFYTFGTPTVTVAETNSHLELTPGSNQTGYGGLGSNGDAPFDLEDSHVMIEAVQVTSASENAAETQFIVDVDGNNRLMIGKAGASLYTRMTVSGSNDDEYLTYDEDAHRWWRIREADGTIYWETSANGTSWDIQREEAAPFAVTSMTLVLQVGTYVNVASPGTAIFDNLNADLETSTYYFDGHNGISDPDNAWTNDANAFDGDTDTYASCNITNGSTTSRYLLGKGTTAPSSGGSISQVRVRDYSSTGQAVYLRFHINTQDQEEIGQYDHISPFGYGSYTTLDAPSGGWTWEELQNLEVMVYAYHSDFFPGVTVHDIDLEVTYEQSSSTDAEVAVSALGYTLAAPAATISTQKQPTVTPSALGYSLQAPAATIQTQKQPTITPAAASYSLSAPAATVVTQKQSTIQASALGYQLAAPAVTLITQRQPTAITSLLAYALAAPSASVMAQRQPVVETSFLSYALASPAATAITQRQATIESSILAYSLSAPTASASGQSQAVVVVDALGYTLAAPNVSVIAQRQPTVTTDVLAYALAAPTSSVTTSSQVIIKPDALGYTLIAPTASATGQSQAVVSVAALGYQLNAPAITLITQRQSVIAVEALAYTLVAPAVTISAEIQTIITTEALGYVLSAPPVTLTTQKQPTVDLDILSLMLGAPGATILTQQQQTAITQILAYSLIAPEAEVKSRKIPHSLFPTEVSIPLGIKPDAVSLATIGAQAVPTRPVSATLKSTPNEVILSIKET